ncbi:hypothetical protein AAG906_003284 [Vitis piasezkii]
MKALENTTASGKHTSIRREKTHHSARWTTIDSLLKQTVTCTIEGSERSLDGCTMGSTKIGRRNLHGMDPKIHDHCTASCIDYSDPFRDSVRGKKNKKIEQVQKCTTVIIVEKPSYCWQDLTMVWFFWTRLESMMFSKIQLGSIVDVNPMLREIKKLLNYDKERGWVVLSNGSFVFIIGHNNTVLLAHLY